MFVCVRNGQAFARKNETSPILKVCGTAKLDKICSNRVGGAKASMTDRTYLHYFSLKTP